MADVVDRRTRSRMMSGIRGKNTRPELFVRSALFRKGFRYRLHDRRLPGHPDIVFPRYHAVIFVHGCFWHRHRCHLFKWPKTRTQFWKNKLTGNVQTDRRNYARLREDGWRILTIWECALKGRTRRGPEKVIYRIVTWLERGRSDLEIRGMRPEKVARR
jgi:DNA mismatch endonuclease (patch repair protein)